MNSVIRWIWQLPQNLLGLAVVLFTGAKNTALDFEYVANKYSPFGVSLGNFIVFGCTGGDIISYRHEFGHHKQSLYLGWLYLLVIGVPSLLGNIYDRLFHKKWSADRRIKWYYSQPWEHWADVLGGVSRN